MNQKPSLEEPVFIEQEGVPPLMDVEQLEEAASTNLVPANEILNRTNFYALMREFVADSHRSELYLLLSPQVYRDVSIFDFIALQRAIKVSYSYRYFAVHDYPRSPMLWTYSRYGGINHDWTDLHCVKRSNCSKWTERIFVSLVILFFLSMGLAAISDVGVYLFFIFLFFIALFILWAVFFAPRHASHEWNGSILDTYPLVDYTEL